MLVAIRSPQVNQRGPQYMEKALAAIHDGMSKRHSAEPLRLVYDRQGDSIGLFCRFADQLAHLVTEPLKAKYPNCELETVEDSSLERTDESAWHCWSAELALAPELFPILRHPQFEDRLNQEIAFEDPVEILLRSIRPDGRVSTRIEIAVRPASGLRCWWADWAVHVLNRSFFRRYFTLASLYAHTITRRWLWPFGLLIGLLATGRSMHDRHEIDVSATRFHEREDDIQAASDKIGGRLFETSIRLVACASKENERLARERLLGMAGALGAFTESRWATFRMSRIRRGRPRPLRPRFLLSHEELATLFHPPTASVSSQRLASTAFTELEAPAVLPSAMEEGSIVLGRAQHGDDRRVFGLAQEDRRRHVYIVGKTGMGKTTLLRQQIAQDIAGGRGVCLIDPHGDLATTVLRSMPSHRTNDVIVFDPSLDAFALSYNPLACFDPGRRDLVADDVLSAFEKIYDLSRTPRLQDTLRNALYVLIEQDRTLLDLLLMLSDKAFREEIVSNVQDDVARVFWQVEFPSWHEKYRTEAMSAIQNKVRPFLLNKKVRAIVGQRGRSLNLRQVMDEGKVLIVNLSKGKIAEKNATLLGALLVTSIQQAAMSRADVAEAERPDFYLYVDEFQNFATGSFATILSEARKYRLNLTIAHQYLQQLDDQTADAVFGNVGSIVAFQVGSEDAEVLARQLAKYPDQLTPQDLANLPKYHAYVRLLRDGMPSNPFSMVTLEPPQIDIDRLEVVCRVSHFQHARPAGKVEQELEQAFACL